MRRRWLGRTFADADDRPGGGPDGPVAVISYRFWQQRFDGAADVVGRALTVDDVPFTIVGVMPRSFSGPEIGRAFDVVLPLGNEPAVRGRDSFLDSSGITFLTIIARLRPEQSMDEAAAGLRQVQSQIRDATIGDIGRFGSRASADRYLKAPFVLAPGATGYSGARDLRGLYERPLLTLMVVVALLLLIACVNVANLSDRARDCAAIRAEPAAGARGVAVADRQAVARRERPALRYRRGARSDAGDLEQPPAGESAVDARQYGISRPLGRRARPRVHHRRDGDHDDAVWHAFRRSGDTRRRANGRIEATAACGCRQELGPLAGWLIVVQVALSLMLVVAAGLFVRTFVSLANRPLGFDPDRVLVVNIDAHRTTNDAAQRLMVYERARDAVRQLPGVADAALSLTTPVGRGQFTRRWKLPVSPTHTVRSGPTYVAGLARHVPDAARRRTRPRRWHRRRTACRHRQSRPRTDF